MLWYLSNRANPAAAKLADRHYSRQKPGTSQFVSPGRCVVLLTKDCDALWVSSWPKFVRHQWHGAWNCAIFRNESKFLSSILIRQAIAATQYLWGLPPSEGMITFVNTEKIKPKSPWNKNQFPWGRCFQKAGFKPAKPNPWTKSGKFVLELPYDKFPTPQPPIDAQLCLF